MINWNKDRSLMLSKCCVYLFMGILAGICVTAPWLFSWMLGRRLGGEEQMLPWYLVTVYLSAVVAAAALYSLQRLLTRIGRAQVFVKENVADLRRLSWYCIAVGIIFLASGLYDWLFWILAAAAAFVGLILRVMKNVFAQAVEIKDENDYTI